MFLSRGDRDLGVAFQTHPGRQAFMILKPTVTVLRERLRWAAESRAGQPPPERGRSPLSAAAGPAPVLSFPKPRTRVDGEVLPVFTAARLCQKQKPPGVLGEVYKVLEKLGSFSP